LYAGPKYFDKLKLEPGVTYNIAPYQKFHSKSVLLYLHNDTKTFEIKSKCTTVNWQKSTKFHL